MKYGLLIFSFVMLAAPVYAHKNCRKTIMLDVDYQIEEAQQRLSDLESRIPHPARAYDERQEKEDLNTKLDELETQRYWILQNRRPR